MEKKSGARQVISQSFVIEVAIAEFEGLSLANTAKRLQCHIQTVKKARAHKDYETISAEVLRTRLAARLQQPRQEAPDE